MSWTKNIIKKDGVDFVPYNANDHPTIEQLVHHYTGKSHSEQGIQYIREYFNPKKKSGGSNDTFFHESKKYGRLAFRISKKPIYTYEERGGLDILFDRYFNTNIPSKTEAIPIIKSLDELAQTEKNWLEAYREGICPIIIYYGYIKYTNIYENTINGTGTVQLKSCLITEAYDKDLDTYYIEQTNPIIILKNKLREEKEKSEIEKIESEIEYRRQQISQLSYYVCQKLVELISKYVELNIVCSDIKPANVVIKIVNNPIYSSDDIQVRLIDLDGDFCKTPEHLEFTHNRMQLRSDTNQITKNKDNYKILLCIIMANHFYYYIDDEEAWDVFNNYFTNKRDIFNKREELRKLFEGELETMCEYYFIEEKDSNGITIRGFIDPDSLEPDGLFDKLFDNVVLKPESAKPVSKSAKKKPAKSVGLNRPQKKLVKKGGKSKKTKKSKKLNKTKKSKK